MWSPLRPSEQAVRRFLSRQAGVPFSYAAVGASNGEAPAGYDLDHNRARLGCGAAAFAAACAALCRWQHFPGPWTRIVPDDTPLEPGHTVAVLARAFGLWWLNAARIVYVIEEPRRFGFAYGTLPSHVESGEERFLVEWLQDDSVWCDIRAFSRPRHWAVRLGYPLARRLQRRFVRESQAALQRVVEASCSPG